LTAHHSFVIDTALFNRYATDRSTGHSLGLWSCLHCNIQ